MMTVELVVLEMLTTAAQMIHSLLLLVGVLHVLVVAYLHAHDWTREVCCLTVVSSLAICSLQVWDSAHYLPLTPGSWLVLMSP